MLGHKNWSKSFIKYGILEFQKKKKNIEKQYYILEKQKCYPHYVIGMHIET